MSSRLNGTLVIKFIKTWGYDPLLYCYRLQK